MSVGGLDSKSREGQPLVNKAVKQRNISDFFQLLMF